MKTLVLTLATASLLVSSASFAQTTSNDCNAVATVESVAPAQPAHLETEYKEVVSLDILDTLDTIGGTAPIRAVLIASSSGAYSTVITTNNNLRLLDNEYMAQAVPAEEFASYSVKSAVNGMNTVFDNTASMQSVDRNTVQLSMSIKSMIQNAPTYNYGDVSHVKVVAES